MTVITRRNALLGAGSLLAAGCSSQKFTRLSLDSPEQFEMISRASSYLHGPMPRDLCFLSMNGLHFLKHPQWEREDVLANSPRPDGARGVFDGVDIDRTSGHIFFSDMGVMNQRDGAIYRCDRDGQTIRTVVEPGGSFTPKQLKIDQQSRKLYWSDREGMAVMRCNNDGSGVETLVRIGDPVENKGDQTRWCVGMALDPARQQIYWSQKGGDNAGQGVIRRCGMELPEGETPDNRSDIETLFAGLPEPIDLDLDLEARMIYWTDRGDNTVSRAPMDLPPSPNPFARNDRDILVTGLQEAIGIALLPSVKRMAFTSLGGEVGISNMDGSDLTLLQQDVRPLTGIAWWA